MGMAYLFSRPVYRTALFFRRWYVEASRSYWVWIAELFRRIDRRLALKINIRFWFQPLYGDYTALGKLIGPVFRTGRITGALAFYGLFFSFSFLFWLCWLGTIPFIVFKIVAG